MFYQWPDLVCADKVMESCRHVNLTLFKLTDKTPAQLALDRFKATVSNCIDQKRTNYLKY